MLCFTCNVLIETTLDYLQKLHRRQTITTKYQICIATRRQFNLESNLRKWTALHHTNSLILAGLLSSDCRTIKTQGFHSSASDSIHVGADDDKQRLCRLATLQLHQIVGARLVYNRRKKRGEEGPFGCRTSWWSKWGSGACPGPQSWDNRAKLRRRLRPACRFRPPARNQSTRSCERSSNMEGRRVCRREAEE